MSVSTYLYPYPNVHICPAPHQVSPVADQDCWSDAGFNNRVVGAVDCILSHANTLKAQGHPPGPCIIHFGHFGQPIISPIEFASTRITCFHLGTCDLPKNLKSSQELAVFQKTTVSLKIQKLHPKDKTSYLKETKKTKSKLHQQKEKFIQKHSSFFKHARTYSKRQYCIYNKYIYI